MKNIFILIVLSFTFITCTQNQNLTITDTEVNKSETKKYTKLLSRKCDKNFKKLNQIFSKNGITYLKESNKKFTGCVASTIDDYHGNEYITQYKNGLKDGFDFFEGDDPEKAGAMKKTCSLNKKGKVIKTFKSCYINSGKPGYQKTGYTSIDGKDKTGKCYDFKCKDIDNFLKGKK